MHRFFSLSPTPLYEDCAQIGSENYYDRAKVEIEALRKQIIRILGEPPSGATLKMRASKHDYGIYYGLAVYFNDNNEEAVEYAYECENAIPDYWDDEALKELEEAGFPAKKIKRG